MGMAASQSRLLALTSRKNYIGWDLTLLSNQKMSLTREMEKVSSEYTNALNAKVLKWSNNQGVSYVDLSYNNLMKPSTLNNYNPYLLTDHSGKVVLDNEYKKYAEMISPKGLPGGDWENNRSAILSELTGLSTDDIDSYFDFEKNMAVKQATINEIKRHEAPDPVGYTNIEGLLEEIDTYTDATWENGGTRWKSRYLGNDNLNSNKGDMLTWFNELANYTGLFFGKNFAGNEDVADVLESAIESYMNTYDDMTDDAKGQENWHTAIDHYFGYVIAGLYKDLSYTPETGTFPIYDLNDPKFDEKKAARDAWEAQFNAAMDDYNNCAAEFSSKFTSAMETDIEFYDSIFSTVAEKGWNYNENINDTEYLNQMLQNNYYTVTSVKRDSVSNTNEYKTDIASNIANIYSVNNSDIRDEALVKYENKKAIIQSKESKINVRMKNLETEQSVLNQMIQGIKSVRDDNISRYMKIFTG